MSLIVSAHAQTPSPISGEIDLDGRTRTDSYGHSYAQLYSAAARVKAELGEGLRLEVYGQRVYNTNLIQQAEVEKDDGTIGAGLIRLPFGIYDTRETYASGLINYPLVRGDYGTASVNWGVPGAVWMGGSPSLQVQAAAFSGIASGNWNNKNYVGGGAVRVQTYRGDLILGVSRWDGYLSPDDQYAQRQVVQMNGLDMRYTRTNLILRGEYILGTMEGMWSYGWYADIYYRLPKYQKWTIVARLEQNKPSPDDSTGKQTTLGARYVLAPDWVLSANWVRNNGADFYDQSWTIPTMHSGDLYVQIYHKILF